MKLNTASFWVLPILASIVAIGPLSTDMYLPAQPSIKSDLNASIDQIQLTLSVFLLGTSLSLPFWGPLADRFGRRNIIIIGFSLFILSSFACASANTIEELIFFRLLQSIGACVGPTIGRTMVRDIYGHEGAARAFGYLASIMALAPAIAPIIGGFIVVQWTWREVFYALAFASVISIILYLYFIGETLGKELRQSVHPIYILKNYSILVKDRNFFAYTFIMSAIFSGLFAFISVSSFIIIEFLKLTPQQFGFCFTGMVIGFITGASSGARLTGKINANKIILLGVLISTGASIACLSLSLLEVFHPLAVVIPIAFYAMGTGIVMPQCSAASLRNYPHMAGTASSLSGIIQNTSAAIAGIGVAWLHKDTPTILGIFLLCASLTAIISYKVILPKSERDSFKKTNNFF
jgi:DHA1 family bicyclomycin/chloramphenicol resistance-like MFS transporter